MGQKAMPKPTVRPYSRYSRDALALLGNLIREGRTANNLTTKALSERAGISRALLQRIEKGNPGCAIGAVFEVSAIVGVSLFESDAKTLGLRLQHSLEKKALLPKAVRVSKMEVKDDF